MNIIRDLRACSDSPGCRIPVGIFANEGEFDDAYTEGMLGELDAHWRKERVGSRRAGDFEQAFRGAVA